MLLRFDLGERKSKEIGKIILLKIISHNYYVRQLMLTAPVVYELKKHCKYEPICFHSLSL